VDGRAGVVGGDGRGARREDLVVRMCMDDEHDSTRTRPPARRRARPPRRVGAM
jgi:hypothetical protein